VGASVPTGSTDARCIALGAAKEGPFVHCSAKQTLCIGCAETRRKPLFKRCAVRPTPRRYGIRPTTVGAMHGMRQIEVDPRSDHAG
jgi:hypothetical protein